MRDIKAIQQANLHFCRAKVAATRRTLSLMPDSIFKDFLIIPARVEMDYYNSQLKKLESKTLMRFYE